MSPRIPLLRWVRTRLERRLVRRSALVLAVTLSLGCVAALYTADLRAERHRARLESATEQFASLTDGGPADDARRAAIAWGYAERMRLGLESPFRLVDAAAHDSRLTEDERHTVSWALLARIAERTSHAIDPAVFDQVGPAINGISIAGEQHLALMDRTIRAAGNPRAAELAVRLAYTLAATERIVDANAPALMAEAAALLADRELAHREAVALLRGTSGRNPIATIHRRRAQRAFYVERPVLLAVEEDVERAAIDLVPALLDAIRTMPSDALRASAIAPHEKTEWFAQELAAAGTVAPPVSALAVTVQRYVPLVRGRATGVDVAQLKAAHNGEMLVSAVSAADSTRRSRRVIGRLLLAAAVAQRSGAQQPVAMPSDSAMVAAAVATATGVAAITFDRDVPAAWRPHLLRSFADGVRELRRVLPTLSLSLVQVRFRMTAPADSALAMHDPRTRTLHLPAVTAGGTLLHEIAHELDRQSAHKEGFAGYRSDLAVRTALSARQPTSGRVAASLRSLTEDVTNLPRVSKATERPAEIFATQVDWFVAHALAREGRSSGFLSGVQDELLTGHVVHPERLRSSGRSRSLLQALEGMTTVSPRAREDHDPTVESLLRWSLSGPVDRRVAMAVARGSGGFGLGSVTVQGACEVDDPRAALLRIAAESRARGWLRQRARWIAPEERPTWARAMLHQAPWAPSGADSRIAELRDNVLIQLASTTDLPAGLSAYGAATATRARCG
jgi:hypothetical protein